MAATNHTGGTRFDEASLAGYYKLNDNGVDSGPAEKDLGLYNTGISYETGLWDKCSYSKDVADACMLYSTTDILAANAQYSTASFWCKVTGYQAWNVAYLLGFTSAAVKRGYYYSIIYVPGDGSFKVSGGCFDRTGSGTYDGHWHEGNTTVAGLDPTAWHHYVYVLDNYVNKIYVDGILKHTFDLTAPDGTVAMSVSTTTVHGSNNYGILSASAYMKGYIDELIVESRVWTADEILAYYTNPNNLRPKINTSIIF